MTKEWWGSDVVPRIQWRLEWPEWKRYRRTIGEGEEIPDGYGIAYYETGRAVAILYPLPINLIVGAWRSAMWHLRCPPWRFTEYRANLPVAMARREGVHEGIEIERNRMAAQMRIAYDRGYADGSAQTLGNLDKLIASMAAPKVFIVEKGIIVGVRDPE